MHYTSLNAKKIYIIHALTVRSGIQRGSPPLLLLYVWLGNKFIWAWCINSDSGVDCRNDIKHVILLLTCPRLQLNFLWYEHFLWAAISLAVGGHHHPIRIKQTLRLCSTGINHFWLVGVFLFYWQKTFSSWFGWSTFSTVFKPVWEGWKSNEWLHESCLMVQCTCRLHNDYSQKLPSFNQKWLEKCSILVMPTVSNQTGYSYHDPNKKICCLILNLYSNICKYCMSDWLF